MAVISFPLSFFLIDFTELKKSDPSSNIRGRF
jgi:hypothetical protein